MVAAPHSNWKMQPAGSNSTAGPATMKDPVQPWSTQRGTY